MAILNAAVVGLPSNIGDGQNNENTKKLMNIISLF
jgi:hypothetical protein